MIYAFFGAFGLSFLALFWMGKLLGDAGAYKQAFLIVFMGTLGWCMPLFLQVFVLAAFVTIAFQYWEETKPAFIAWAFAVVAMLGIGHAAGGSQALLSDLNPVSGPAEVVPVDTESTSTTP